MISWNPRAAITLTGKSVSLEPLSLEHHDDLVDAVRDGDLWRLAYTTIPSPDEMRSDIERRLSLQCDGSMLPFAVRERSTNRIVGMTTYMHIDAANRHLEIGSTWYRRRVQRTALNTECKLLLLTNAFEVLDAIAVEFRTSSLNLQSRAAIERLGAKLDGILRSCQLHKDGSVRDTYAYSIIAAEWPAVRARLTRSLGR